MFRQLLIFSICIKLLFMSAYVYANEFHAKPKFKHMDLLNYGVCRQKDVVVDLSKALYLQNTSLSYLSENVLNKFYLNGQEIIVQKDKSDNRAVFSLVDFLEERYKLLNPDIDLSFVLINNELFIYWRETFLHRSYKQGVVAIRKNEIVAICDGLGGVDSSH